MLAGMGGVSYHRLVAAVSEAGGFGCMGASTMAAEQMRDEIAKVRELTAKPFGVDLLTAAPGDMAAKVNDIIDGGGSVFVAGLGVPRDVVDLCHSRNVLVVSMCGKVRHAIAAVEAGCDIVVAQGTEAGGHTGKIATFALVPQIVDAVGERVPVVAAGGIVDGRGLAAVARARRRRHLGRHPLHRHARGQQRARLQGGAAPHPRGRHRGHQGVHRQDVPRDREHLHEGLRRRRRRARAVPDAGREVDAGRRQPPRRRPGHARHRPRPRVLARRPGRRRRSTSWCPPASWSSASCRRPRTPSAWSASAFA